MVTRRRLRLIQICIDLQSLWEGFPSDRLTRVVLPRLDLTLGQLVLLFLQYQCTKAWMVLALLRRSPAQRYHFRTEHIDLMSNPSRRRVMEPLFSRIPPQIFTGLSSVVPFTTSSPLMRRLTPIDYALLRLPRRPTHAGSLVTGRSTRLPTS